MIDDYRYTKYEKKNPNMINDKIKFIKLLQKKHKRTDNHYALIRNNSDNYKLEYLKIFDYKCVYCGNSLENIPIYLFEIDHYINQASSVNNSSNQVNHIDNLFPACKICNSKKSNITFKNKYIDLFEPCTNIQNVFYRDELYNIRICKEYCDDEFIKLFYTKLKLDNDARRIDYLLLCMRGLVKKVKSLKLSSKLNEELSNKLNELIIVLQSKRNCISVK